MRFTKSIFKFVIWVLVLKWMVGYLMPQSIIIPPIQGNIIIVLQLVIAFFAGVFAFMTYEFGREGKY